jgi:hypothetical protein
MRIAEEKEATHATLVFIEQVIGAWLTDATGTVVRGLGGASAWLLGEARWALGEGESPCLLGAPPLYAWFHA